MAKQQQTISYRQILADLKEKKYKPVYFLSGEEPYFIDLVANYIADNVLTKSEQDFNQTICYGKETSMRSIIESARAYPMMAEHQVIIVKEAQEISKGEGESGSDPFDALITYLKQPMPTTILVFCYKKRADMRKKYVKAVNEGGVFYNSERVWDNQLPKFIQDYITEKKILMEAPAVQLLADYIGNDLHRLVNELEKLVTTKPPTVKMITLDFVEKNVGISKEFNNFELRSALMNHDINKANFIALHLSQMKTFALTLTISTLYSYFSNLMVYHYLENKSQANVAAELSINPFFVSEYAIGAKKYNAVKTMQIISILREYDAKSKGVDNNSPQSELLMEMVYKILH